LKLKPSYPLKCTRKQVRGNKLEIDTITSYRKKDKGRDESDKKTRKKT
jgi:hypothetical protein